MSVPFPGHVFLMVTLTGVEPGAPLDAATALADDLDARRVPLTLLVGPRPHPEVAAWARARRRAGDAVLLHGLGDGHCRGDDRMPAHEAGLRLAGALRARDALGLPVDGFATPGWVVSNGTRHALGAAALADLAVLVAADGIHRLGRDGAPTGSCRGTVSAPDAPAARRSWPVRAARPRPARAGSGVVHLTTTAVPGRARSGLLAAVDEALAAGAMPGVPAALVPAGRMTRRDAGHDPEHWSITA